MIGDGNRPFQSGDYSRAYRLFPAELETPRDPLQGRRSRWHVRHRFAERHHYLPIRLSDQWPTRDVDHRPLRLRRDFTGRSPRKTAARQEAAGRGHFASATEATREGTWAETQTFSDHATRWLYGATMAESTRSMRKSVLYRDILPAFNKRLLGEIHGEDLRALCMRVRARGAPATAVHIRDLVKQIYGYANLYGEKVANPADSVEAASIATFVPKDRALSPQEIHLMSKQLE